MGACPMCCGIPKDETGKALEAFRRKMEEQMDKEEMLEMSYAMKEQLETVRSQVHEIIHEQFEALFQKTDCAGVGFVSIEDAQALFEKWGLAPPDDLRSFDANRDNRFEAHEFAALLQNSFVGRGHIVAEHVLPGSRTAQSWSEACWELGIRRRDMKNGEPAMPLKTIVELFARVAEITGVAKMTEEEVRARCNNWDHDASGHLAFDEFTHLYYYLLWVIYEAKLGGAEDLTSSGDPECVVASGADVEKHFEVSTLAMKEQLERARANIYEVIHEQICALFRKMDKAGKRSVPVEDVIALLGEMNQAVPEDLKASVFNQHRDLDIHEFDATIKSCFFSKGHKAVEYLLMHSSTALAWTEESWNLGVGSSDVENAEVVMRVETVVDLFRRVGEVHRTPGMSEEQIRAEIRKFDTAASGSLTPAEYTQLYLYFLWVMYEDLKAEPVDQASDAGEASTASGKEDCELSLKEESIG
eukprot:TRINITY_DN55822_c0_g1_i1.p1 TRINITY_DN55822_c0_g1~~TRINITY_DN55822_c0_g1_i1.p1  ORF type:complete len:472 (-),score=67.40 TRINITY_DN55822_c0_g1_i1:95-1510(-)